MHNTKKMLNEKQKSFAAGIDELIKFAFGNKRELQEGAKARTFATIILKIADLKPIVKWLPKVDASDPVAPAPVAPETVAPETGITKKTAKK